MKFQLHDQKTAPAQSQPLLAKSLGSFGMIPNLHAVMAESPAVLEAYQMLHAQFQASSFDPQELTVIWQTINIEHECHYCIPAHSAVASMMNVDAAINDALRNQTDLPSEKLQVLRETTLELVRKRGHLSQQMLTHFVEVGYAQQQLLEIVLGISQKVMSNYINHLADTPLDEAFAAFK